MPRPNSEYIVDRRGQKRAVILPIKDFNRLIERLEELEDALSLEQATEGGLEFTDYREIREELKRDGRLRLIPLRWRVEPSGS